MDPRTAAQVLKLIAAFLELRGASKFKSRAYEQAGRAVAALDTDDLAELDRNGTLAHTAGLGPATLSVVRDLIATSESRYLEELRAELPAGLVDLLGIPGLPTPKIRLLHESLGIDSVDALEAAIRDGRLAALKGFGPKTSAKLARGIEIFRTSGSMLLYHRGALQAHTLLGAVRAHPDVTRAEIAGSVRRHNEVIGDTDIVAACGTDPIAVANSSANASGVRSVTRQGTASPSITFVDGVHLDLFCTTESGFTVALWRATGSEAHVTTVVALLARKGIRLSGDTLVDSHGAPIPVNNEADIYALVDLPFIPAEMREDGEELLRAVRGPIPPLVEDADIRGALHCHSDYSDGKATIAQMANAARALGWSYIGITDHSQAAFYAGGMSGEKVLEQHEEIDRLNAESPDFRILKGIEADILADGAIDYDADLLDRFDFVVGSVHSRFSMDRASMTARMLRALDDPHLTILGHPTGRLLLSRDPYPVDIDAVLEKAVALGVAVELNADPKRLDLDWRILRRARALGATIAIGPDAHSTKGLEVMRIGVGIARKAGIQADEVLNGRSVNDVLAFARARREVMH
ncbi:MAG: PHP domain-containing protein [Gemmatimonadota bacterium]|nr:PHP domain-containing protein [Gemmatimonadota bacterium]